MRQSATRQAVGQHQTGTFRRQYGSPRKSRLTIPCQDGTLLLDDVSSSYDTGRRSDLVKHGYSRDGKPAVRKQRERCTEDGLPVQSLRCLLRDLATICRNTVRWRSSSATFERVTLPTDSQRRALELLGVSLEAPKEAERRILNSGNARKTHGKNRGLLRGAKKKFGLNKLEWLS